MDTAYNGLHRDYRTMYNCMLPYTQRSHIGEEGGTFDWQRRCQDLRSVQDLTHGYLIVHDDAVRRCSYARQVVLEGVM